MQHRLLLVAAILHVFVLSGPRVAVECAPLPAARPDPLPVPVPAPMPVPVPVPVPAGSNEVPVLGDEGVAMLEEKPRKPQRNHPNGVLNPPRKLTRSESSPALQNTAIDQSYRYNELTGHKNDRDSKRERNARLIKGTVKVINYAVNPKGTLMGDAMEGGKTAGQRQLKEAAKTDTKAKAAAAKFRSLTGKKKHDPKPDGMLAAVAKGAAKNGAGAAASSAMSGFADRASHEEEAEAADEAGLQALQQLAREAERQQEEGPPPNVPGKMPVGRLKSAAKTASHFFPSNCISPSSGSSSPPPPPLRARLPQAVSSSFDSTERKEERLAEEISALNKSCRCPNDDHARLLDAVASDPFVSRLRRLSAPSSPWPAPASSSAASSSSDPRRPPARPRYGALRSSPCRRAAAPATTPARHICVFATDETFLSAMIGIAEFVRRCPDLMNVPAAAAAAAAARPPALLALRCWLHAHPSSFDVKKDLLLHALAVGNLSAARALTGPLGRTALSFRYKPGVPFCGWSFKKKSDRRANHPFARGRAGMTLLQAVLYKAPRMCLVPRDRQQLAGADFLRAVDGGGGDGVEPWRSTLEEAVVFILERSGGGDAANALSLGGKTALDIALEVHAYWRRAGPWGAWEPGAYFGDPGSGAQKKVARGRAELLERAIAALVARGGRCASEALDLRAAVWRLDVDAVRRELDRAQASGGVAAARELFSARNFRGLSPLPLALDLVVANALAPRRERVTLPDVDRGAAARGRDGDDESDDAATAALENPDDASRSIHRSAAVAQLLLDAGADPDSLAELFLHDDDDDDGFWDRDLAHNYCDWAQYHADRLVGALDRVLSRLDGAQRERCLASRALGDAVVARLRGMRAVVCFELLPVVGVLLRRAGMKPMGGGGGAAERGRPEGSRLLETLATIPLSHGGGGRRRREGVSLAIILEAGVVELVLIFTMICLQPVLQLLAAVVVAVHALLFALAFVALDGPSSVLCSPVPAPAPDAGPALLLELVSSEALSVGDSVSDPELLLLEETHRKFRRTSADDVMNAPRKLQRTESSPALQNTEIDKAYRYNSINNHKNALETERDRKAESLKENFGTAADLVLDPVGTIKSKVQEKVQEQVISAAENTKLGQKAKGLWNSAKAKIKEKVDTIKAKTGFDDKVNRLKEGANNLKESAANKMRKMFGGKKHDPTPQSGASAVAIGALKGAGKAVVNSYLPGGDEVTTKGVVAEAVKGGFNAGVDHHREKQTRLAPMPRPDFKRSASMPASGKKAGAGGPGPNLPGKMPVGRFKGALQKIQASKAMAGLKKFGDKVKAGVQNVKAKAKSGLQNAKAKAAAGMKRAGEKFKAGANKVRQAAQNAKKKTTGAFAKAGSRIKATVQKAKAKLRPAKPAAKAGGQKKAAVRGAVKAVARFAKGAKGKKK
ncbi:hypothetical protein DFJ73DRAFT_793312 [Zopfochytrium polystomum]|nr:hypothetical protein DFJ73DRAFT_793312 [Zopfochytrium polystomum]